MRKSAVMIMVLGLLQLACRSTPPAAPPAADASVSASVAYEAGMQYAQQALYDQAIAKFEEAVRLDPGHAQALNNMGACYIEKGQDYYATAREKLERAVSLPRGQADPKAWYNLTVMYTLTGIYDRAFEALDKSLGFGFKEYDYLRVDEHLYELRRKPEFRKVLEKHNVFL